MLNILKIKISSGQNTCFDVLHNVTGGIVKILNIEGGFGLKCVGNMVER